MPKIYKFFILLSLLQMGADSFLVHAKTSTTNSEKDMVWVKKAKNFLKGIQTLSSKFIQTNIITQQKYFGDLLLDKKQGLRLNYDENLLPTIISNLEELVIIDGKNNNYYPLEQTPAYFLLQSEMNLKIIAARHEENYFIMTIQGENDAIVSLCFQKEPIWLLTGWLVERGDNIVMVNFLLDTTQIGIKIDPKNFQIR